MRTLSTIIVLLTISLNLLSQDAAHLLIVTGGHDFERPSFFEMFESFEGITYQEVIQETTPSGHPLVTGKT